MLLKELKELYEEKKKDRDDSIANGVLSEFLNGEFTMLEKIIYRMENKRKPLSDGTLPMTSGELEEFKQFFQMQPQKVGKNDWTKVERVYIAMRGFIFADILSQSSAIRPIQEPSLLPECVKKYTAILYLAERFDLTEK